MAQFIPIIFVDLRDNDFAILYELSKFRAFFIIVPFLYRKESWKHRLKKYPPKYFILAIFREIFVTSFPFFALMKNKMYTVSHFYRVQSFLLIPEKSNAPHSEFETRQRGKL